MKKAAIILILLGLTVISYPVISNMISDIEQQKTMDELKMLNENLFAYEEPETPENNGQTADILSSAENTAESPLTPTKAPSVTTKAPKSTPKPIGAIRIDKIKLYLPVLYDSSKANLNRAACQVKGTTAFGEIGNTAIAAHRSHRYGKMFNRLNELDVSDKIVIEASGKTYTYIVYEKIIVPPEDTTVLYRNKKDRILTLITCDPVYNPVNRLIIHAKMQ